MEEERAGVSEHAPRPGSGRAGEREGGRDWQGSLPAWSRARDPIRRAPDCSGPATLAVAAAFRALREQGHPVCSLLALSPGPTWVLKRPPRSPPRPKGTNVAPQRSLTPLGWQAGLPGRAGSANNGRPQFLEVQELS